jgi:predicted RNA-binding Zn-ribbon protein involved in translation (DUF1610 family)
MGKKCLKCLYERQPLDSAPDYECPNCGAIYSKVEAAMKKKSDMPHKSDEDKIKKIKAKKEREAVELSRKDKIQKEKTITNNALVKCEECGHNVSKKAEVCPSCGAPVNEKPKESGCATAIAVCIIIFALIAVFSSNNSLNKPRNSKVSDSGCKKSLQCWGDKHNIDAGVRCDNYVEKLAKYSYKWTNGMLESKFSRFRWKNKENGVLTFIGDKIEFQNGFGAWQNSIYECDYNPALEKVLDVRARAGRL